MGKWIDINEIPPPICDTFIVRLEPDGSIPNLLPEVDVASIDIDGDGKADINIDTNGDGKPDLNIDIWL